MAPCFCLLIRKYIMGENMGEEVKKNESWDARWLTIPEFADAVPLNLFHKEQVQPSVEDIKTAEFQNVHVFVRGHFTLERAQKIFCKVTADDHYKAYLDGAFMGEGPAAAYHTKYYYNVLELGTFAAGEHVLALHLYYQGLVNRVWNSGDLRFAFAAELWDEKGKEIPVSFCFLKTDCYEGETVGYETQFLENFDSSQYPYGWKNAKFDESGWKKPVPAGWADYTLTKQPTEMLSYMEYQLETIKLHAGNEHPLEPIKLYSDAVQPLKPTKSEHKCADHNSQIHQITPSVIRQDPDGSILLDAGEEITGMILLTAEGKDGDQVKLFYGEELDETGSVRYDMRCNCCYREIWTLADGRCEFDPYDYKGFRYVKIVPDGGVKLSDIRFLVRHYPMDESLCELKTEEKTLENIFQICKNAVRLGTQENYVDCPTREKGQYLGDAVVTAHAQVLLTGKTDMLLKCIDQFAQTARVCPGLLAVAPGGLMQEIADFSLLYSQLLLLYYRFTGEKETVDRYYGIADGILKHFSQYAREDGLLEQVADKWNLVDWPENLRDGYDFPLTRPVVALGCHNVINALYIGAMETQNTLAEICGREMPYQTKEIKKAYRNAFYREKTGLLADSETSSHAALHSNVYAMYFHLLPEADEEKILTFMKQKGFSCGVMLSYFVLRVFAERGQYDMVYELLVNEGEHGWVNMLREGATTCFEAWGKDQKWNTSLCHPWASAPIPILIEEIAGVHIDAAEKGGYYWTPHIPKEIREFRLCVPVKGKKIIVEKKMGEAYAVIREDKE